MFRSWKVKCGKLRQMVTRVRERLKPCGRYLKSIIRNLDTSSTSSTDGKLSPENSMIIASSRFLTRKDNKNVFKNLKMSCHFEISSRRSKIFSFCATWLSSSGINTWIKYPELKTLELDTLNPDRLKSKYPKWKLMNFLILFFGTHWLVF